MKLFIAEWIIWLFLIFVSPLFFVGLLRITWVLIDIWIDIIFTPLEFLYNKINNYLKQKELENDPHYIEGINDAVWWEEDDD
jgi:hypothetical protein